MIKLYPYQLEGVRLIDRHNGVALLADEMGLGKTPQGINYYKNFVDTGPALVVCPSNVKYNWQREFAAQGIRAEVLGSRTPPDEPPSKTMKQKKAGYIINYDVVGDWMEWLQKLQPTAFLFDEAHAVKNRDAQRTKHIRKISRLPSLESIIAISGTPLTNRPHELWTILNILWPKNYPSFWAFAFKYCEARKAPWGWQFTGAKNLDELHAELTKKGMIRRLKRDVLKDLPDKTRMIVPVELSPKGRKEYEEAEKRFLQWLAKRSKSKANAAAKAERLVQMGYLKRLAAELKMKSVYEWVDDFLEETDDKLIAFGVHKKVVRDGLFERYKKQAVVVDGTVEAKERQRLVDRFTRNKTCRLFVGNIQAAGVGWNGTAASTVLFAELDWVPANHTQAEDRPHRIGQKGNVLCVYLVAKDTIEHRLCEVLQEKQETITHVMDGQGRVRDQQLDLLDRLEQKLLESRSRD